VHQSAYGIITSYRRHESHSYRRHESHWCYCGRCTTQTDIEKKECIWKGISQMTKTRISTFPDRHPLQIIGPSVWFLSLWEQKRTSIYQIFKAQCLRLLNETLLSYITLQLLAPTLHETWESCQPPLHFWKFTKADQAEHLMTHEKKNRWLSWSRLRGTNRFNLLLLC